MCLRRLRCAVDFIQDGTADGPAGGQRPEPRTPSGDSLPKVEASGGDVDVDVTCPKGTQSSAQPHQGIHSAIAAGVPRAGLRRGSLEHPPVRPSRGPSAGSAKQVTYTFVMNQTIPALRVNRLDVVCPYRAAGDRFLSVPRKRGVTRHYIDTHPSRTRCSQQIQGKLDSKTHLANMDPWLRLFAFGV